MCSSLVRFWDLKTALRDAVVSKRRASQKFQDFKLNIYFLSNTSQEENKMLKKAAHATAASNMMIRQNSRKKSLFLPQDRVYESRVIETKVSKKKNLTLK